MSDCEDQEVEFTEKNLPIILMWLAIGHKLEFRHGRLGWQNSVNTAQTFRNEVCQCKGYFYRIKRDG